MGGVIAQIAGKLHVADGERFQQFVEILAEARFIKGSLCGERIPKSSFHRRAGGFFHPPLPRKGAIPAISFCHCSPSGSGLWMPRRYRLMTDSETLLAADSSRAVQSICDR